MTTTNTTTERAQTPIFFETLEAANTSEAKFREDTKALDIKDWADAKEVADSEQ